MSRAAVVVNPTKCDDIEKLRGRIADTMGEFGWAEPLWLETTATDPGLAMAAQAAREAVDVVFACGGDGTVRACAAALAGTGVPLAVLPLGTGNLLARNLGLPMDLADALQVGIAGAERLIDVGVIGADKFVVMAGIGFDAAMLAGTNDKLKASVGPLAYLASALGHLRDRPMRIALSVDDGPPVRRRAAAVLVGNLGRLQGGVELLPDARPDDGLLDVAVLSPRGLFGWARLAGQVLLRRRRDTLGVARIRGRKVEVTTRRPHPCELDGDPTADASSLIVSVDPGALVVRVPRDAP